MDRKFLRDNSVDLQSFLLLKAGLKPVIRLAFPVEVPDKLTDFSRQLKKEGLYILKKEVEELYGSKLDRSMKLIYISQERELAVKAFDAEKRQDRLALAKLLGYPDCCARAFLDNLNANGDMILPVGGNTKRKFSFYCNNIFCLDSKLKSGDLMESYMSNQEVFYGTGSYFLIRHIPCSFDCPESIEIGRNTYKLLLKEAPDFAREIIGAIKRPLLYFDCLRWIVFDGRMKNSELLYKNVLPYRSLVSENILKKIKAGNCLKITDRRVEVFSGRDNIFNIKKEDKNKGIIFNFE